MNEAIKLSIVVPLYNEEASVTPLYVRLTQVMTGLDEPYEIVFVDDGSTDQTFKALYEVYESDSRVSIVTLRRNFGQTPALSAPAGTASDHHLHGRRFAARPRRNSRLHHQARRGLRHRQRLAGATARQVADTPAAEPYRELDDGQAFRSSTSRFWHDLQGLSSRDHSEPPALR